MSRAGYVEGVTVEGARTYDDLFADGHRVTAIKVTVLSGESAAATVRGAVMGIVTVGGKARVSDTANVDGSETPDCILAHPVDASAADAEAMVYKTGHFNRNKLVPDATIVLTDATVTEGLRVKGITYTVAQTAP